MADRVVCIWSQSLTDSKIAEACYRLSPQIALRPGQAVFLEIGKCGTLYREETCLLRLRVILKRLGQAHARIGVAGDLPSALAAAVFGTSDLSQLPLAALECFLMPLRHDPVLAKKCAQMVMALERMGLQTIAEFLSLNPRNVIARFGVEGELTRRRITDRAQFLWPPFKPNEPISEQTSLAEHGGCFDLEMILFPLRAMIDRAMARLWGRSLRVTQVRVLFELDTHSCVREPKREFLFGFSIPQGSARAMLPILRERLSLSLSRAPLESPVMLVRFDVLQSVPGSSGQKDFFDNSDEQNEMLGAFTDRMRERLGTESVFSVRLCERYLPEKAWEPVTANSIGACNAAVGSALAERPTRVFAKPVVITPSELKQFRLLAGPERIASEWWSDELNSAEESPQDIVRDYFRVQDRIGRQWWVYRTKPGRESQQVVYFAAGVFD